MYSNNTVKNVLCAKHRLVLGTGLCCRGRGGVSKLPGNATLAPSTHTPTVKQGADVPTEVQEEEMCVRCFAF